MLETTLNQDLKTALLAGDKTLATTLRGLKSALLYAQIANNSRDRQMTDDEIIAVLQKEAKKRQESADLYLQGGNQAKADAELHEKAVIQKYLPAQLSEAEIVKLVEQAIKDTQSQDQSAMGLVIGKVKQTAGAAADGVVIARLVKERLSA